MYIRHLVQGLSVSEQIVPHQLAELKARRLKCL